MNGSTQEPENTTLDDRIARFWEMFDKMEMVKHPEIASERGMVLATLIIPELESDIAGLSEAMRGLLFALGSDTQRHSKPVVMAQIKARAILKSMEPDQKAGTEIENSMV